jgi:hypothetical protein
MDAMEIRRESKKGTPVTGIDPVLVEIQQRLKAHPQEWLKALQQNPGGLANLEQEIHHAFAQMADRVVAGLLAEATAASDFADAAKKK